MRSALLVILVSITTFGQSPHNQAINQSTILVQDVVLTGVQNIGTAELNTPRKSANKVDVQITVHEGKQYVLGNLMFTGNPELAPKLRTRWELEFGKPYDGTYIKRFIEENESLLPANSSESRSVTTARDCRAQTVTVLLDLNPEHPTTRTLEDSGCEPAKEAAK